MSFKIKEGEKEDMSSVLKLIKELAKPAGCSFQSLPKPTISVTTEEEEGWFW